ncbi:diphosphate--fructose-6-phosphate 1-phosphotransferase [Paludicola sp. MB14-C6]|uniref:diphosphate--fructose-6-phosphate 1-phosphotransferase n=1 Tax=Paludihabitans sp. MB14-C6 TaxID=3070656 RepID=UPI0027DE2A9E|nr:diphosphate--fructose-6-phosphate 1-phosphotransferase [Paludicola sp. MB14-C6]WMJ24375.1 diphosphate--fructose-6-phosphate 1-phosphotransferase [Paludicola sp. MB14-C6]
MKNILIGLSGGPSVAINSSLAGIMKAATKSQQIDKIYGAVNGIEGVLNDTIIDLGTYTDDYHLSLLQQTPAMALGSCRHKLKEESYPIIQKILEKYEVGYFFYIGGNDSMDTVLKLNQYFKENQIAIQVIGVPKTIDNDLPVTDHTPGFGSAAKYLYHTISEIIRDSQIYPVKNVVIVEIMGRNSGWLTLASALPRFLGGKAPHIIAIPETSFYEDQFIEKIKEVQQTEKTVICVVSEGIKTSDGEYVGMSTKSGVVDSFGHTYLSGVGKYLEGLVMRKVGCKVRSIELNVMQRCSSHLASKSDIDEATLIGEKAVEAAENGESGITMVFQRTSNQPYQIEIAATDVANIANKAKDVPIEWFDLENEKVQKEIVAYMLPLIQGDINPIKDETGLPIYINLR